MGTASAIPYPRRNSVEDGIVNEQQWLAERFEEHRAHLGKVAYRMLGDYHAADDAVQEAWLRLSRSDASEIANLGGWLTTVVARVCLDALRSRNANREETLEHDVVANADPEDELLIADSLGVAVLIVLILCSRRTRSIQ